jgi:hypothetical protein
MNLLFQPAGRILRADVMKNPASVLCLRAQPGAGSSIWLVVLMLCIVQSVWAGDELEALYAVGVARVDITPREPIRLTGYAVRRSPSEGVEQRLWAKALAVGQAGEKRAVLVTIDNCGISAGLYRKLVERLQGKTGLAADEVALAVSHTHSGPCTTDWAPNIFAQEIPADQQAVIDRYTGELEDHLEAVAVAAMHDLRSARLSWAQGEVGFAKNRRPGGGPVDQSLPILKVEGSDGNLIALVANYACHCTTLGGDFNKTCGDWAGYAQEFLERDYPGALAFVTIGCGADANPSPRGGSDGGLALARQHGQALATEVQRLLKGTFRPLPGRLRTARKEIELPYSPHFSRAEWEERAKQEGIVGFHARKNLARLERGEAFPAGLYYPVVTWEFGGQLAWVFLPGEVVVDYALRLKRELDSNRLWITAYANYVPCYIPSRRILAEGGYEAETSLWYYDRPARLASETEDLIVRTVHTLLPEAYRFHTP